MTPCQGFVCGLLTVFALLPAQVLKAAELVVVDQDYCPYCERFESEIAPAWPKPATLTPTFILIEDGKELGRLVGYAGDEHFWFLVGELLENLNQNSVPATTNPDNPKTEPTDR